MIISDLDGTIIPHGGVVSEANKRAIESFRAGGGHFGIATGRTPEAAAGYLGGVAITAPSVFFNGSMLYDWQHERVLVTKPLTAQGAPDLWPRFAALCLERFPKACIEVYTQEDCHIISDPKNDDPRDRLPPATMTRPSASNCSKRARCCGRTARRFSNVPS